MTARARASRKNLYIWESTARSFNNAQYTLGFLTDEERLKLSPTALLALSSGSMAEEYVDEVRQIIRSRFFFINGWSQK